MKIKLLDFRGERYVRASDLVKMAHEMRSELDELKQNPTPFVEARAEGMELVVKLVEENFVGFLP